MSSNARFPLRQQMFRGAGLWQALVAIPIGFVFGSEAFESVLEPWRNGPTYYFIRGFLNALMAAGIIFAVYVQQNSVVSAYQNMLFEAAKSLTATVMWLWLVLDSAFGPWYEECNKYYYRKPCDKGRRIAKTAVAVLVLFALFYPTLAYSYFAWKNSGTDESAAEDVVEEREPSERSPLLSS